MADVHRETVAEEKVNAASVAALEKSLAGLKAEFELRKEEAKHINDLLITRLEEREVELEHSRRKIAQLESYVSSISSRLKAAAAQKDIRSEDRLNNTPPSPLSPSKSPISPPSSSRFLPSPRRPSVSLQPSVPQAATTARVSTPATTTSALTTTEPRKPSLPSDPALSSPMRSSRRTSIAGGLVGDYRYVPPTAATKTKNSAAAHKSPMTQSDARHREAYEEEEIDDGRRIAEADEAPQVRPTPARNEPPTITRWPKKAASGTSGAAATLTDDLTWVQEF